MWPSDQWLHLPKHSVDCQCRWAGFPDVIANYTKNWQPCAERWAFWGRAEVADQSVNTNNHLERWFGMFKYIFLGGKKMTQLTQLVALLVEQVMPFYVKERVKKLAGLSSSRELCSRDTVLCAVVECPCWQMCASCASSMVVQGGSARR